MIEVMVGAAILLLVTIGILPLFTRAMIDNTAGADYTKVSNFAKSRAEDFIRAPFSQAAYALPAGAGTTAVIDEYMEPISGTWKVWPADNKPPVGTQWRRTATIRHYAVGDIDDDQLFNTPLDGNTGPEFVHLKECTITVQNISPATGFGLRRQTTLRILKAF
ncbi:MAG TPA: hypothetical protein VHQ90_17190 [Thermoanaerobaculia bacterium]|nr:hypothetical protein [Thermoanaerobaculia bacterium]